MAKPGKKAGKRAAAPRRAKAVRKSKAAPAGVGRAKPKTKPKTSAPTAAVVKLKSQLRAVRDRQNATADILKVIASSPSDVQPVFQAIAESARRLLGSYTAVVTRVIDGMVHLAAGTSENEAAAHAVQGLLPYPLSSPRIHAKVARTGEVAFNVDAKNSDLPQAVKNFARTVGWRSMLVVPMLRKGAAIGTIGITRREPGSFEQDTIELLKTFADQAVIAIENTRLFNEVQASTAGLQESLQQQTATADILKVISDSPGRTEPVFDKILASARQLCEARFGHLLHFDGETWRAEALHNLPEPYARFWKTTRVVANPETNLGRVQRSGKFDQVADVRLASGYAAGSPLAVATVELGGARTLLTVPLLKEGKVIGGIAVYRTEVRPFDEKQIRLLSSFADQAVIAIENARLFNETQETLERQTATSEILKVIASSPSDVQPVFEAIATRATQLIGGHSTTVLRVFGNMIDVAAFTPVNARADAALRAAFPMPIAGNPPFEMLLRGETSELADTETDTLAHIKELARSRGFRSRILVPLRSDGNTLGAISVTRIEPGSFADHHKQLLQTFADQAVIAIENVRLFRETQEALQRQTATADILKVIASSPSNVEPVFQAIADQSNHLLNGLATAVYSIADDVAHLMSFTPVSPAADAFLKSRSPVTLDDAAWGANVRKAEIFAVADIDDASESPRMREIARIRGWRSCLFVPLLREGTLIGTISVTRREPGAFADDHVQLLRTFADQAVIAIENARLFNEVQAKTADLQESLQQQIATADVLKVISRSTFDLDTVLTTLTQSAAGLCRAARGAVFLRDGDVLRVRASTGNDSEFVAFLTANPVTPTRNSATGRTFLTGEITHLPDVLADPEYDFGPAPEIGQFRSALAVPLLRQGRVEGVFALSRPEPGTYTDREIELVQTFADQAVIAIENVRLFNETQEALERQTATADILKVIASSPDDVQPVFEAIALRSNQLISGLSAAVYSLVDNIVHLKAFVPTNPAGDAALQAAFPRPMDPAALEAIRMGDSFTTTDSEIEYKDRPARLALARARGYRSSLGVPLMRDGKPIGLITVTRVDPGLFDDHHVQLLKTFADQAVIAISNVELFTEVQARTADLQESLQQQTATADVLKVISRSAFDLDVVMHTLAKSARDLCGSNNSALYLRDGEVLICRGVSSIKESTAEFMRSNPVPVDGASHMGRALLTGTIANIEDFENSTTNLRKFQQLMQFSSFLAVPLLRDGSGIGVFILTRDASGGFTEREIELVQGFADQAVIAIENARLLRELHQRTDDLSKSLDDLRTAQDRLVQTEKLASLGQLTAGIAHEIKNPLNFVNNFSALSSELTEELNGILRYADMTDKMRQEVDELTGLLKDNLEKVVQHGKRADSIVKNMLLHSRAGSGEQRLADINALVDESLNLAYHGARAERAGFNITLRREFDAGAGSAELFPQEISRALLNLISNGFYAATRRSNDDAARDFEPTLLAATRDLGSSVEIRIRDNGAGIPPAVREKMFNPFFTTKPAGEGTGLGLSMTHDIIVKQHGGSIDVATEPGQFSEFTIVLPRASRSPHGTAGKM